MKAIILSAGKGTRLGNLTKETPKALLPISGKPIIERIILWLIDNGINNIGINLHTFSGQIKSFLDDNKTPNTNIHLEFEENLSGTAGAIKKFQKWLVGEENFIVIYGDILTNQNLSPLINKHLQERAFATLFVHKRKISNSFIQTNQDGRITSFIERPEDALLKKLLESHSGDFLVNSGIQVLNRQVLDYIIQNNSFDLPKDVYIPNIDDKLIYTKKLTGLRVAVDSKERYKLAEELFK